MGGVPRVPSLAAGRRRDIGRALRRHGLCGAVHLRSGGLLPDGGAPLVPQGRRSDGGLGLGKKPKPSDEETRLLLKQVH